MKWSVLGSAQKFDWRDWYKSRKTQFMMSGVRVGTQTQDHGHAKQVD
jgi:hypothetical protein